MSERGQTSMPESAVFEWRFWRIAYSVYPFDAAVLSDGVWTRIGFGLYWRERA